MRYLGLAIGCVLGAGFSAVAQVDESARQKLQGMVDAVKQMQSLTYSVVYKGEGGFSSFLPETRADVAMLRGQDGQWKMRITGTKAPLADTPALDFVVVVDGNLRIWQDDNAKMVYERAAHVARAEHLDTALLAALRELYQLNPFEKDLQAETIRLEPATVVNGIPVDVVFVDPGHNQPQNRYYIGLADRMPRKVEQVIGALGSMSWTIGNVLVNPPVAESAFKVDVPDGYTFSAAAVAAPPPPMAAPQSQLGKPAPAKRRSVGTEIDDLAPEFSLADANGAEISLSSLKGNVVVLAFWGTWNAQSKRAVTALQGLHKKYQEQPVKILGLSFREANEQNPRAHFKDQNLEYPLLVKADELVKTYKVKVPPTFFVIGKEGEITYTASGYNEQTVEKLEQEIKAALARRGAQMPEDEGGDASRPERKPAPSSAGEEQAGGGS